MNITVLYMHVQAGTVLYKQIYIYMLVFIKIMVGSSQLKLMCQEWHKTNLAGSCHGTVLYSTGRNCTDQKAIVLYRQVMFFLGRVYTFRYALIGIYYTVQAGTEL